MRLLARFLNIRVKHRLADAAAAVSAARAEAAQAARDRETAVEARRQSDARFRLLFMRNPMPMYVFDVATLYFLEVNDAAIEHYGYSREEFLRMRITEIRPPEDIPHVQALVAELSGVRDRVRRHQRRWQHRLKDGRIRDVEIASHAIDFGGRHASLVVARDVTELTHAERALATSAARLEILHAIDRAVIAGEPPTAIAEIALGRLRDLLDVPRAIANVFDLSAGTAEWLAAAGRKRIRVGPGVRFDLRFMGRLDVLHRGEVQVLHTNDLLPSPEAEALLASGVTTYMVVPMVTGGELIGAISFGGASADFAAEQVDIAREVAAQLAIAVAQARLRERVRNQAARLELLHEIDRAIITSETPEAMASAVLPRLRDLLGVSLAIVTLFDLEAGQAEWLAGAGRRRVRVGPGIRYSIDLAGDVSALKRGVPQTMDVAALPASPEREVLEQAGIASYVVVPMIAAGDLIGSVSIGVTAGVCSPEQVGIAQEVATQLAIAMAQATLRARVQQQAEELEARVRARTADLSEANDQLHREIAERQRMEAEADRANRAKSEFLSRMSHELRTPLNSIIGFAQLLEMDALSGDQRESLDHILRGARHLLALINEVLDIARIEADRLSISVEPVMVRDVVGTTVDLVRPQAVARRVSIDQESFEGRWVLADRQRLQQVLLNLLSNAVKYNREGGRITVACEAVAPSRLRLAVTDTGRGIAHEMQKRLFTPFDRLGAETEGIEGTGLGLALSKRLVEAMGGALVLDSCVGVGSTFAVELPAVAPADERPTPEKEAARQADVRPARGTVLYVEDNVANLRLFERIVARRPGVTLLSAMQGRRALELARHQRPDVIVLDLHLPDLHGSDVLSRLRDDPRTVEIPVIVLSADATPGQVNRVLGQGAHAYLTKPVDVSSMLLHLDRFLSEAGR